MPSNRDRRSARTTSTTVSERSGRGGGRSRHKEGPGDINTNSRRNDYHQHESITNSSNVTNAKDLLNFRTTTSSSLKQYQHQKNHKRHHNSNSKHSNNRETAKKQERQWKLERMERQARQKLSSAFYLHSSPSHAFVISRRRRRRRKLSHPLTEEQEQEQELLKEEYNYSGPDALVPWEAVRYVKSLVAPHPNLHASSSTSSSTTCPICLDTYTAPRITKCGHVYCYPCILRHLFPASDQSTPSSSSSSSSSSLLADPVAKCPCCSHPVQPSDLRPVEFHTVQSVPSPGSASIGGVSMFLEFRKLHRVRNNGANGNSGGGSSPFLPQGNAAGVMKNIQKRGLDLPTVGDVNAAYSRYNYVRIKTYLAKLREDVLALRRLLEDVSCTGDGEDYYVSMALSAVLQEIHRGEVEEIEEERCQEQKDEGVALALPDEDAAGVETYLEEDCTHFYQSVDGQLCFLSAFNMHCLEYDFAATENDAHLDNCGDAEDVKNDGITNDANDSHHTNDGYDSNHTDINSNNNDRSPYDTKSHRSHHRPPYPNTLRGRVVDVERIHLTPDARKRLPFLSHLPLYADVTFVEIDLGRYLSQRAKQKIGPELEGRKKLRKDRKHREKRAERAARAREEGRVKERLELSAASLGHWSGGTGGGARIDPNDEFFHVSATTTTTTTGTVAGVATELEENGNPSSPSLASMPSAVDPVLSFRSVCASNGAFPSLASAALTSSSSPPSLSSFPSLSLSQASPKRSTGDAVVGAWNARRSDRSSFERTTAIPGAPKMAVSASPASPSLSAVGKKGRKKKVLLFSTGGGRGSSSFGS